MLYDGVIKFLNQAKELLLANDMAGKGNCISKSLDIINELDSSLNLEKGGELAANLHSLYFFCSSRLVMANLKKDPKIIDEVIKILSGIRNAYEQIISLPEAQAAAQMTASSMSGFAPRGQVGVSPSGGATPAPGAGARIRNMYAQQQQLAEASSAPGAAGENPVKDAPAAQQQDQLQAPQAAFSQAQFIQTPFAQAFAPAAQPPAAQVPTAQAQAAQAPTAQAQAAPVPAAQAQAAPAPAVPAAAATLPPQSQSLRPELPQEGLPQQKPGNTNYTRRTGSELYRKFAGQ